MSGAKLLCMLFVRYGEREKLQLASPVLVQHQNA
jgi:hypothetical protein